MDVNLSLKEYIQKNILPIYDNNYIGDGVERIEYVLRRAEEIIQENSLDVNDNILYTAICCHDIRFDNFEENHEIKSAKYMLQDAFFNRFFNQDELTIIRKLLKIKEHNLMEDLEIYMVKFFHRHLEIVLLNNVLKDHMHMEKRKIQN